MCQTTNTCIINLPKLTEGLRWVGWLGGPRRTPGRAFSLVRQVKRIRAIKCLARQGVRSKAKGVYCDAAFNTEHASRRESC